MRIRPVSMSALLCSRIPSNNMPLRFSLLLAAMLLLHSGAGWADTATIDVMYLPLDEAVAVARSQLSAEGRIAQLPSQRILIVSDDAAHIEKVRDLLRQLDRAPTQFAVQVEMSEQVENSNAGVAITAVLPGGWVRLDANASSQQSGNRRDFMLRTSSGAVGHIEAGEIRAVQQSVRNYLTAHGIVSASNVAFLDVTGGFDVQATLLSGNKVRLSIRPWLRQVATNTGNTQQLVVTNAPLRINTQPQTTQAQDGNRIMVAEAATEVTVKLGERVSLAASHSAANEFSTVLLGLQKQNNKRDLTISVRVSKAGN